MSSPQLTFSCRILIYIYALQGQRLAAHRLVCAPFVCVLRAPSTDLVLSRLSNTKPSAIFRLRGTFIPSTNASSFNTSSLSTSQASATLGILCEPIASVEAQIAALSFSATAANPAQSTALVVAGSNAPPDPVVLAQKVAKNLFNAVGSFAQGVQGPDGKMIYGIDLAVIEKWYT